MGKLEELIDQYEENGMDTYHLEDSLTLIEATYLRITQGKPLGPRDRSMLRDIQRGVDYTH